MVITLKEFSWVKNQPEGSEFNLKVDFGLREITVVIVDRGRAVLGKNITLDLTQKIKDNFCYWVDEQGIAKIAFFSPETNKFYKLTPTSDWPTLSIGSVPMHRLASPCQDTQNKIKSLKPYGIVLDTCLGLGYTAISAAGCAGKVITFEKDENVLDIVRKNPLSDNLFTLLNIEIREQDVFEGIDEFENNYFDCIIHDPPTFKLAQRLFSRDFYRKLLRVLKKGGKVFHYTPLYKIKSGYNFPSKIRTNLIQSGFKIIGFSEPAGGFICRK